MKKRYTKPAIVFEDFTLSTDIAGHCSEINSLQREGVCGIDFGGDMIFLIGIQGCLEQYEYDGEWGLCYHNPGSTARLFAS